METSRLNRSLSLMIVLGMHLLTSLARADVDAVTVSGQAGGGFIANGVGFSFTPSADLEVTRVGYKYFNDGNPVITVWSNTNLPMAAFPLTNGLVSGEMVYSNVSLILLAGHRYSITLQQGPLSNGIPVVVTGSTNGQFQVATQLTSYASAFLSTSGTFGNFETNTFYLGPNFSFQVSTSVISAPLLSIALSNASTAIVSWPAPSSGFVLQRAAVLGSNEWGLVTNTITVVSGTNEVAISPLQSAEFFRLIYP